MWNWRYEDSEEYITDSFVAKNVKSCTGWRFSKIYLDKAYVVPTDFFNNAVLAFQKLCSISVGIVELLKDDLIQQSISRDKMVPTADGIICAFMR